MNLAMFDLNLLVTFDALMNERNVTRAGQKIGLSQPAMSAALSRLRYLLKDELFVRHGNGMRPTPRAFQIAEAVHGILSQIHDTIAPQSFDPLQAKQRFRIAMNDLGAALFLPPITQRLDTSAPGIDFEVVHANEDRAIELLEEGKVDVAATIYNHSCKHLKSILLYQAPFVCALRRGHPYARRNLSLEEFAQIPRVAIAQRDDPSEHIDKVLAKHGLTQRVRMIVPHYLAVPFIVAQTDLMGVLPLKMVDRFEFSEKICIAKAPFREVNAPIRLVWNQSVTNDPANKWLRSVVVEVTRDYQLDKWIHIRPGSKQRLPAYTQTRKS